MKCPLCNLEGRITASAYVLDTEGEEPKLFSEQSISCVNKNCPNNGIVFATVKNPLEVKKG